MSGSSGWSRPGPRPPGPPATSSSWSSHASSNVQPDVQMLMDQVRQLQQQVQDLNQAKNGSSGAGSGYDQYQPTEQRILLVSNVPNSLSSCDALFFMFDRLFQFLIIQSRVSSHVMLTYPIYYGMDVQSMLVAGSESLSASRFFTIKDRPP